jgi:hemerythrin
MDESPRQPSNETVEPKFAALHNGIAFTDNSHVAFVEITKRLELVATSQVPANQFPDVASLLHCYLGNAR